MAKTKHLPGAFCWFELATTDQDAAKAFYSSVFGWTPSDNPMGPGEVYTIFRIDGQDAAAGYGIRGEQRAQSVPAHWMIYVLVESADQTSARARELGATVLAGPFDVMENGRMSVIQDPAGAPFCVWQPLKHGGTTVTDVPGAAVWADLNTPDQVKCGQFYGELLGWRMVEGKSMRPAVPGSYFHIVNRETLIGGILPSEHRHPGTPPHWLIYFQVDDCDAAVAKITSLGGTVWMPPMEMGGVRKVAVLSDPQGAAFAIVQPLAAAAHKAPARKTPARKAPGRKARTARPRKRASKPRTVRKPRSARKAAPVRKTRVARKVTAVRKRKATKKTKSAARPKRKVQARKPPRTAKKTRGRERRRSGRARR